MALKKGTVTELDIESTAFKGKGIAKVDGLAVFVPGTAPGDKIKAMITRKKKSFREAKILEILEPSPLRIDPLCSHANTCGGCTWQHIPYEKQIEFKEQHVRDHITRIAGLDESIVQPIIGCDQPFYYRNKMEYSFGTRRWLTEAEINIDEYVDDSAFAAGMHAPGRYDKILNLNECHLQEKVSFQLLDTVRGFCIENGIEAFNTHKNEGYMRHLVVRTSGHTDDLMVNLVTYRDEPDVVERLADLLLKKFPQITTIVNNVNDQPNPTAVGRFEHVIHGPGYIVDHIGSHSFKIHANAFFQTNTLQAEKLYSVARDYAGLNNGGHLFDLYCGVGTLSLYMADKADKVTGIEIVDVAVENARFNASENGVKNAEFVLGDMKDTFNDDFLEKNGRPDCIITDPPRSGMHPDVVDQLCKLDVDRMVYVSCNPSTMARDLKTMKEYYNVESVQPVDMFPQTYHIEAVTRLTKK
ncbi:23S rRNA (uracil(1939)-C(5))-methyltransferase RlmD [Rhodohalobacter sp. SW132]|uniref:23S rRNA (uracil(1939)-C(5))-methyltransferase RlmD n=1 Tax=Rhodohalobacter sp. SW132 TaxID=2293433 RepID=UPI000E2559C2|nr:23S rRNA (uracil(1939)-C(5))-methyltransferase RlmD [Rhodohalobacter sp. SW132]REL24304.1 23S rRNA (uracil(1939)-C(5))-methyltransferase RlmD [Rhodohalobacter sp. SW132]